jgi:hypothetical protein
MLSGSEGDAYFVGTGGIRRIDANREGRRGGIVRSVQAAPRCIAERGGERCDGDRNGEMV